jgi:hypothetical protein
MSDGCVILVLSNSRAVTARAHATSVFVIDLMVLGMWLHRECLLPVVSYAKRRPLEITDRGSASSLPDLHLIVAYNFDRLFCL